MDDDKDDKDPGELEHEDVTKLRHGGPTFEREDANRKKSLEEPAEPPAERNAGDSEGGSGESSKGSPSTDDSE